MGLKEEIKKLSEKHSQGQSFFSEYGASWLLLKVEKKTTQPSFQFQYYLIPLDTPLGSGSYGEVYKAYKVDQDANIDLDDPVAIKKFEALSESEGKLVDAELKALQRFSDSKGALHRIGSSTYLFSTFLPGKDLEHSKNEIACLDLFERINLICQLLLQLNHLHHHTNYGRPLLHGDLKSPNVMFSPAKKESDEKMTPNQCTLIDFGLSMLDFDNASQLKLHPHIEEGDPRYFPPETVDNQFGLKVDIFMMANVIVQLLGEPDPFQDKVNASDQVNSQKNSKSSTALKKSIAAIPLCISNLVSFPEIHRDHSIKGLMIQFINQMQHPHYHDRPDSDAALRFFFTLRNLLLIDAESFSIAKTELFIYANGLWPRPEEELAIILKRMTPKDLKNITQAVADKPQQYSHLKLQIFILNYKKACRFSFFGNIGRSEFGKKIFRGQLKTLDEVMNYTKTSQAKTAKHIFQKLGFKS